MSPKPKQNAKNNNTKKKQRKRQRSTKTKAIPIAIAASRVPTLKTVSNRNGGREMIIEGADMVIPAPTIRITPEVSTQIFMQIPANPLYWTGCRIAGIAQVYQNYRPLKFDVEYIPQVPVTVPGQVTMGTFWNASTPAGDTQQSLLTSNGGKMIQCYERCMSRVVCNTKTLPLRLYNMRNSLEQNTSNPFIWLAHYSGGTVGGTVPGYVFVRWRYLFADPIGSTGEAIEVHTQTTEEVAEKTNSFAGWGVALGILKTGAIKILKRVAIVLLNEALTTLSNGVGLEQVNLYAGSIYAYDLTSISNNDGISRIKDDQGNVYEVPDDTRVAVYESGPIVKRVTVSNYPMFTSIDSNGYTLKRSATGGWLYFMSDDQTYGAIQLGFQEKQLELKGTIPPLFSLQGIVSEGVGEQPIFRMFGSGQTEFPDSLINGIYTSDLETWYEDVPITDQLLPMNPAVFKFK